MDVCNAGVYWATFWVLSATLVVLLWYAWETRKLRQESQKQTFLMLRPFVVIKKPDPDNDASRASVKNIGNGSALHIRFKSVQRKIKLPGGITDEIITIEPRLEKTTLLKKDASDDLVLDAKKDDEQVFASQNDEKEKRNLYLSEKIFFEYDDINNEPYKISRLQNDTYKTLQKPEVRSALRDVITNILGLNKQ